MRSNYPLQALKVFLPMTAGNLSAFGAEVRALHLINQRWQAVAISSLDADYDRRTDLVVLVKMERNPDDNLCGRH